MKALNEMTPREAAQAIYDFARENAKQVYLYASGYDWLDPNAPADEPTNEWECSGEIIDFAGLKLKVKAKFECPNNDDWKMCDEECCRIIAEYYDGTDEQLIMFDKYCKVIEYELEKIAGDVLVMVCLDAYPL